MSESITPILIERLSPLRAQVLLKSAKAESLAVSSLAELSGRLERGSVLLASGERFSERSFDALRQDAEQQQIELWNAEDAAFLCARPVPATLAELGRLAEDLAERLAELDAHLLPQLEQIAGESSHHARLGFFQWELARRFDALSMPRPGETDMELFFPQQKDFSGSRRQDIAPDILEKTLGARQAMSEAFGGYEERPQQQAMAQAVENALSSGRSLVVEAGTGVGKSLAYLVPAAIHSARSGKLTLISTNTLNLQQQIVDLDIPRMRRILPMLDLRVTLLKGREHYLCLKRLQEGWLSENAQARRRRNELLDDELPALLYMLRLLMQCSGSGEGDLDLLPSPRGLKPATQSRLAGSVDCSFRTCLGERCEFKPRCHFFTRRGEAALSHLVVTNHALVFSLFSPDQQDKDNLVSRADVIVFDEAHNIESAITNQMTLEFSHLQMVDIGNQLLELTRSQVLARRLDLPAGSIAEEFREQFVRCQNGRSSIGRWIQVGIEVRDQVNLLLRQAGEKGYLQGGRNQISPETATEQQQRVVPLLEKLAARLAGVVEKYAQLALDINTLFGEEGHDLYLDDAQFQMDSQALRFETLGALTALQNWRPGDKDWITWFNCLNDAIDEQWDFRMAPLNVGKIYQQLAVQKESIVLSSATLTVAGRFDYLQQSLGFDEASIPRSDWLILDSPFDYQQQSLLLVATDIAVPTGASRNRYLEQLERLLHEVQEIFQGGVLVLFNSYRDLNHIAEALAPSFGEDELLIQGVSGSRSELAEQFRESGDRILLATRSFWEGFDVAGDALRCVVLAKLPFANLSDPIHAGRQRAIDQLGGDSFREYSLPLAAMLLKQGFGRLIRGSRDYGCVFLLDSRVSTARYGKVFLDSLPGPRVVSGSMAVCLEAARKFMAERKPEAVESQDA